MHNNENAKYEKINYCSLSQLCNCVQCHILRCKVLQIKTIMQNVKKEIIAVRIYILRYYKFDD